MNINDRSLKNVENKEGISLLVCQGQLDSTIVMILELDKLLGKGG